VSIPLSKLISKPQRWLATGLHLLISAIVAVVIGICIKWLLFPGDYAVLAGGQELFWLIVSVDVIIGPILTAVIFNPSKHRRELQRDLSVIVILQFAALMYGLHTLYIARPIALVFEVDRFRVVTPANILIQELPQAPEPYRSLPLAKVWTLGTSVNSDAGSGRLEIIQLALQGYDVSQRPSFWQSYELSRPAVLKRARSASFLIKHYQQERHDLETRLSALNLSVESALFLPVQGRVEGWVVLLRPNGDIAGFAPYDGFFSSS
jgi:hypothetical protein